ncbi:hypothetical protein LQZ19_00805 [Treponema primitia]|uniref:hypothetical protein n=1 Tax=Treponema primitia TaxID=88058 RepID=UPI0039815F42
MKKLRFCLLALWIALTPVFGETELHFTLMPGGAFPLGNENLGVGTGASAALALLFPGSLGIGINGGYSGITVADGTTLGLLEGGIGPVFQYRFNDRFSLRGEATLGVYRMNWKDKQDTWGSLSFLASGFFHLTPSVSLGLYGGYTWYHYEPDIRVIKAGASIKVNLTELVTGKIRIRGEKIDQHPIFPVSYAWYEKNSFATLRITNEEPNAITEVEVSLFLEQYMNQPTKCMTIARLEKGESADIPLTALFNESMMDLTENISVNVRAQIQYRSLGVRKSTAIPLSMPVYNRNAMNWDDDRRAAAFVSSRDPSAAYFSRYTAGIVEARKRRDIPPNVQYAIGLFEALNVYGIKYIIDPLSSYVVLSEDASAMDSLNYPYQTLLYRGGDCDDLSILFCSLLETLGIKTAFLTIPGHIYIAFDTGLTEGEVKDNSQIPLSALIAREGKLWMPLEITLPEEGFNRAWRIGIQEWERAGTEGQLYPMSRSWEIYPSVSIPRAGQRIITVPDEKELIRVFEAGIGAFLNSPGYR